MSYPKVMKEGKKRTVLLGLVFLFFLFLAYVENMGFYVYIRNSFSNPPLAVVLVFVHNVLAISLIMLGMAFYVEVVLTFMPKRRIEFIVLEHPSVFAVVFTVMILLLSIFRASTLVRGEVEITSLVLVFLVSAPTALVEGYGIFEALKMTFSKSLTLRSLVMIYLIFFFAAVIEVGFVQFLLWVSAS